MGYLVGGGCAYYSGACAYAVDDMRRAVVDLRSSPCSVCDSWVHRERDDTVHTDIGVGRDVDEPELPVQPVGGGHDLRLGLQPELVESQVGGRGDRLGDQCATDAEAARRRCDIHALELADRAVEPVHADDACRSRRGSCEEQGPVRRAVEVAEVVELGAGGGLGPEGVEVDRVCQPVPVVIEQRGRATPVGVAVRPGDGDRRAVPGHEPAGHGNPSGVLWGGSDAPLSGRRIR